MKFPVYHTLYGDGTVTRIYGSRIDIDFSGKTVSMVFPGAFSTGLSTTDKELATLVKEASEKVTRQFHSSNSSSKTDVLRGSGVVPIYPRYSALKILKKICEKNLQLQIKALTLHCDCDAK